MEIGPNGGTARTIFAGGRLEGLWQLVEGHIEVETFRDLTRSERHELDAEVFALESFLTA